MHVTATEMARHFSEYLNRVAYAGETFLLTRGKKVLAELHPAPRGRRLGDLPSLLKGLPHLDGNEATGFERDLKIAKTRLNKRPAKDPWAS